MEQAATGAQFLGDLIDRGGPVMAVLAVLSTLAGALVLAKLYQFFRARVLFPPDFDAAVALARAGERGEALCWLAGSKSPVARVLEAALGAWGGAPQPEALRREETERIAQRELEKLRAYLRGLELIATLAPLLGLLGTVLGMIVAFQDIQEAGSRVEPALLASGIWQALLTTAVGLSLAIPTAAAFNWFERLVERAQHQMEDVATQVFTLQAAPPQAGGPVRLASDRGGGGGDAP